MPILEESNSLNKLLKSSISCHIIKPNFLKYEHEGGNSDNEANFTFNHTMFSRHQRVAIGCLYE